MHWPRIHGLCSVSWCLAEGQWNGDQRRLWAVRLGKDFTLYSLNVPSSLEYWIIHCNSSVAFSALPSVLWHCWLGNRKGSSLYKLSGEVLAWLSVWSEMRMICIWSNWCHRHPIISCFIIIQNGLLFWYRLSQTVLEKRLLNGCSVAVIATVPWFLRFGPLKFNFDDQSYFDTCGFRWFP